MSAHIIHLYVSMCEEAKFSTGCQARMEQETQSHIAGIPPGPLPGTAKLGEPKTTTCADGRTTTELRRVLVARLLTRSTVRKALLRSLGVEWAMYARDQRIRELQAQLHEWISQTQVLRRQLEESRRPERRDEN
jgi:hypothetical protein